METREAILSKKAKAKGLQIPNEVKMYLAHRLDLNEIQLEEALIRIAAYSSVMNRDIDIYLAVEALGDSYGKRPNKKATQKTKKPISRAAMLSTLCGILLLNGCAGSEKTTAPAVQKKAETTVQAPQPTIKTGDAKVSAAQQDISFGGQTEPFQVVYLAPQVSGNVKELKVNLGDYVKKDQPLAEIDESDLALKIKQAEARIKEVEIQARMTTIEQQIRLNELKVTLSQDSIDLSSEKLTIQEAEKSLAEAQANLEKVEFLFQHGGIPQEQVQQARVQKAKAEENVRLAKENLVIQEQERKEQQKTSKEVAKLQQDTILASSRLTKMGVEQAKADLELIRYQYNNLMVKAPINGFITKIQVMKGEAVSPASTMFIITDQDKLYVRADVPEALIYKVKLGQEATVKVPTIGKSVKGEVIFVAPLADPSTQAFPIRILIDNADHEIKGGMRTQVSIKSE